MAMPEPIPSELTEPEPGDNQWAERLAQFAAEVAAEAEMDPDAVALELVLTPSEYEGTYEPAVQRALAWRIDGPRTAEWAMAKLAEAHRTIEQLRAQAEDWRLRIEQWFDQAAAPHVATRAFFDQHLQAYALAERDRTDGKVKTVQLPSGRVSTTASSAKAVVADEQAVVAWADATIDDPDVLQAVAPTQRRVLLTGLRELVQLVEVVDEADLLLHTGEVVSWRRQRGADVCPAVGDGWPPVKADEADDHDGLVAEVRVLASRIEVRGLDGLMVPGVAVEPPKVTAKVVPA